MHRRVWPSPEQVHVSWGVQKHVVVGRDAKVVHQCEWGPQGAREHQVPVLVPLVARQPHLVVDSVWEGRGAEADEPVLGEKRAG